MGRHGGFARDCSGAWLCGAQLHVRTLSAHGSMPLSARARCSVLGVTLRLMGRGLSETGDRRAFRWGLILLVLAGLAYASTLGPPGTLTSIALGALAAYALAGAGVVLLLAALVLRLRHKA